MSVTLPTTEPELVPLTLPAADAQLSRPVPSPRCRDVGCPLWLAVRQARNKARKLAKEQTRRERVTALWEADPHCVYCGRRLPRRKATLDHVVPLSKGGKDVPENMVLACSFCNSTKSDRDPRQWCLDLFARAFRLARDPRFSMP